MRLKRLALLLVVPLFALGVAACGSDDSDTVKIGVADASESYWNVFKEKASGEGIDVELVNFTDYNQPNPALAEGELQLNEFQHLLYLATYNAKNNQNLVPIGATAVYPLPLYSTKHASVDEIPQGGSVVIPNDPTNQARGLLVLQQAGLISLKNGGNAFSTLADIDEGASKVKVTAVDAGQTAQSLDSVDAAIVNNNYATSANLGADKVIAQDDPNSDIAKPYINAFVAQDKDKNNADYLKLTEIYHDPEVEAAAKKDLGDSGVFKTNPPTELQELTKELEAQVDTSGA
ncbi:MAG: methionine ABC transporter substrate-binding protein [Gordonia sp.]|uniref:MetQ/NlpA family ABC transporter substrate-binding protein n=1 Tax=Williamsia sp. 1138 TaxID=1903117 RepID=UPI000A110824|nr:MetQ/NlpA family ABC transporter substrate-binding protein [Williamsia sp. 1138]MBA4026408.1 methionine ABC transporter substrate-binding protein [Gordonia sp. (in: high G+C Gram-positive bacteria)]OZG26620.1 methionine ABC transporter substrate-binding protein [Williamsia sp. 1138]